MAIRLQYFSTVLELFVIFNVVKSSIYDENLAFHCDDFRYSVGAVFRREGMALKVKHVQKSSKTSSLLQCCQLCLAQVEWCVSVNFEITSSKNDELKICELNNYGMKSGQDVFGVEFEARAGFVYNQIRPFQFVPILTFTLFIMVDNINECNGVTCQNSGSCQDLVDDFTCTCVAGYTGRYCETNINECNRVTCQNGGSCQDLILTNVMVLHVKMAAVVKTDINECNRVTCQNGGSCQDLVNDFTCTCVAGYTGRYCETNINECNGVTCQNGGSCQDLVNNFTCTCVAGYTGRYCETNINECNGVTCQNGGSCQDLVNNFTCTCVAGYTGRYCETNINECKGVTCQNGGSCQDLVNNFICTCVTGYTGRYCEANINECNGVTCQNGGSCQDLVNNFTCTCVAAYTGRYCETKSTCDIEYSTYSTNNVILYSWSITVQSVTICSWVKLLDYRDQYPASYLYSIYGMGLVYRSDSKILFRIDNLNMCWYGAGGASADAGSGAGDAGTGVGVGAGIGAGDAGTGDAGIVAGDAGIVAGDAGAGAMVLVMQVLVLVLVLVVMLVLVLVLVLVVMLVLVL
ncbi:hypothetical protein QZH41_009565 [Actinostola sp. cb2023]|nr:hypothetical protein QZH41_009565 [Actinostola sp. cb2023]